MGDTSERQALLMQDHSPHIESHRRHRDSSTEGSHHSDEWWDGSGSDTGSSYSSSYSSGSDYEELKWESAVTDRGELFYIEASMEVVQEPESAAGSVAAPAAVDPAESTGEEGEIKGLTRKRHTAKAKLVRLIRRRNSKRVRNKVPLSPPADQADAASTSIPPANKVTFQDCQEGETKEVILTVDPQALHNLGRRATLCETLLGIVVATFADQARIMVAGFIPNSVVVKHRGVKIGDWLRSVDNQDVTFLTIDAVLATITTPRKVKLVLQRVAGYEVTSPTPGGIQQKPIPADQSDGPTYLAQLTEVLRGLPVGVLYLTQEGLSEGGPEDQGVIYCYPPPAAANALAAARGSFVTLHHLLPDLVHAPPRSSTVVLRGELTHVIYMAQPGTELMLLALPDTRCSLREALHMTNDLVRNLQFSYQTLARCFTPTDNLASLDRFFSLYFARLLSSGLWPSAQQSVRLSDIALKARQPAPPQFEDVMPAARLLTLPRDTQLQIDEALSELEANDFDDMDDDLHEYQRLYTIVGTCLYHSGHLLASHLPPADLADVHSFCRQQGLLHLGRAAPIGSLVVWRRVYPASCDRGLERGRGAGDATAEYRLPSGKWYLLIVGKGQEMLVVLLESGGCTVRSDVGVVRPDVVYVEQARDTLAHLHKLGVAAVAAQWLGRAVRPQVVGTDSCAARQPPTNFSMSPSASSTSSLTRRTSPEVTSILKRRGASPDRSTPWSGSVPGSEDSHSQVSDDMPVLGRRAERERASGELASKLSDSETSSEYYRSDSRSFELSNKTQPFLVDVEQVLPSKLTAGDQNVLYHYVQLDLADGVLMCPPDSTGSGRMTEILHNFRRSCLVIHDLLQNTVQFKSRAGQERSKSPVNKSLIAIKEHGVLFQCTRPDSEGTKKSAPPLTYWVVGRLFFTPLPKEVYVCYQDSAPQNMIEIAFRLGLNASG